ncbi:MAG: SPASM domain-containing protein [Bradymonadales bacterium]|nr:SPASM domain-containing protein [Bradymonadales bacterium]
MGQTITSADYYLFEQDGQRYAFLPSSFAVIEIDALFGEVLKNSHLRPKQIHKVLAQQFDGPAIDEAILEVDSLAARNLIRPPLARPPRKKGFDLQCLLLMVTNACNFACSYCHGDHEKLPPRPMNEQTARRAVDLLLERSGSAPALSIYFFGGEPLLNFDLVKSTVAYARGRAIEQDKKVSFGMTTNGYLLDPEKAAFLHENGFSPLFSMDGPPEVQNACRRLRSGGDTFDRVFANVKHYLELGGPCSARATITPACMDLVALTEFFYDAGFRGVSLEPVTSPGTTPDPRFQLDLDLLTRSYSELAERTLERIVAGKGRYNLFVTILERIDKGNGHFKPCFVGEENWTITAEGDIYPCYRFIGKPGYRMGSVFDGVNLKISRRFEKQNTIFSSRQCHACWARYICGGQCPADRLEHTGSITRPVAEKCIIQKHLFTLALKLYVRIRRDPHLSETCFAKPAHSPLLPDPACV